MKYNERASQFLTQHSAKSIVGIAGRASEQDMLSRILA
jgi:hypothetical protein